MRAGGLSIRAVARLDLANYLTHPKDTFEAWGSTPVRET